MENCSCAECVSACKNDPGRLVPEDVDKIAKHLGISREELISDYLVKIETSKQNSNAIALAPAKRKGKRFVSEPGTVAPDYYAQEKGSCIFLSDSGMCTIHSVKPFECGAYMGCKNTFLGRPYREKQVEEYFFVRWRNIITK
jgi:Fe-S-cluster containining protein